LKNPQILNFMKIRSVKTELFHADREWNKQGVLQIDRLTFYFTFLHLNMVKGSLMVYLASRNMSL